MDAKALRIAARQLEQDQKKAAKKKKEIDFTTGLEKRKPGDKASGHMVRQVVALAEARYFTQNFGAKDWTFPVFVGVVRHVALQNLSLYPSAPNILAKKWRFLHLSDWIPILETLGQKNPDLALSFFNEVITYVQIHGLIPAPSSPAVGPTDSLTSTASSNAPYDRHISAPTDSPPLSSVATIAAPQVRPDDATTPATIQHNPDEHTEKRKATERPDVPGSKRPRGRPRVTAASAPSAGTPLTGHPPIRVASPRGAQASQQPPVQSAAASPDTNAAPKHPSAGPVPPSPPIPTRNSTPFKDPQIPPAGLENTKNSAASATTESQPGHLHTSRTSTPPTYTRAPSANATALALPLKDTTTPAFTHGPVPPSAVETSSIIQVRADQLYPSPFDARTTPPPLAPVTPAQHAAPLPNMSETPPALPPIKLEGYVRSAAPNFFTQEVINRLAPEGEINIGHSISCEYYQGVDIAHRFVVCLAGDEAFCITKNHLLGDLLRAAEEWQSRIKTEPVREYGRNCFAINAIGFEGHLVRLALFPQSWVRKDEL